MCDSDGSHSLIARVCQGAFDLDIYMYVHMLLSLM